MLRSIGILLVALSLCGPSSLVPLALDCPRCADHCPMKKPHLPCHSAKGLTIAGCSHQHSSGVELVRDVALPPAPSTAVAADVARPFVASLRFSFDTPFPEPPTDPPRLSFAV